MSEMTKPEHAAGKEGDVGEKARVAGIHLVGAIVHVALGVDKDHQADKGHHEQHQAGQGVHLEAQLQFVLPVGMAIQRYAGSHRGVA